MTRPSFVRMDTKEWTRERKTKAKRNKIGKQTNNAGRIRKKKKKNSNNNNNNHYYYNIADIVNSKDNNQGNRI